MPKPAQRRIVLQSVRFLFSFQNSFVSEEKFWLMYRCHFLQAGRITQGCNLRVETLDAAIATSQKILADQIDPDDCDRLEIWLDTALVYEFSP
jgi:hypothetical protein